MIRLKTNSLKKTTFLNLSPPRRRGSSDRLWIPAFAGMTVLTCIFLLFSGCSKKDGSLEVVRKAKVTRDDLKVTISATGEVKPQNRVEIKPSIAGRIEEVLVKEGEEVKQGQILAWMSSTDRAVLLDSARSQGQEVIDKWKDAYKPAPLIAPLDGTVILRAVEPGQTVTVADPVVVLADRLIVEALVDETDLSLVKLGQAVDLRLDAYPGDQIPAKVDHIAYESRVVNNVSVYPVDVLPTEVPDSFRSGMTATVTFIVANKEDVLLIPSDAISEQRVAKGGDASLVTYRRSFGKLKPIPIKVGESDGRMTELVEGLKEGDSILVVRKKESGKNRNPFSTQRRPQQNQSR